jgi:hypothetical protein
VGGNPFKLKDNGERDYYIDSTCAVLWEDDAPPKVLKNDRFSEPMSILVEDGDMYVFGVEHEYSRTTWIKRDVMWKNDEPAVPVGPERVFQTPRHFQLTPLPEDESEEEECYGTGYVSDGDIYSASGPNRGTVLKNGQPLFTLKPKFAGANCTIEQIAVVK